MIILRINNELIFASDIVADSLAYRASERGVTRSEFDEALLQFVFYIESCAEAAEVFDRFTVCPICGVTESKGVFRHKDPADFLQ